MSLIRRIFPDRQLSRPLIQSLFSDPFFDLSLRHHERDLDHFRREFREEFSRLKAMNVTERKDDVLVEIEVPGMKKEDLDLVVRDDTLTVTGKMESSDVNEDKVWAKEVMHFKFMIRDIMESLVDLSVLMDERLTQKS